MRDFLRGTFGILLQVILVILGMILLIGGCIGTIASPSGGILVTVLGILCLCAAGGIRYWLGHIIRNR